MDQPFKKEQLRLAAIIPAFNEESNIARVLTAVQASKLFAQIIVVDDGSTDKTAEIAHSFGVEVIRQKNSGKGAALCEGARRADADILCFLDADLVGLTPEHINDVVSPVVAGSASMAVGLRDKAWFTHIGTRIAPVLGGERALHRELFLAMMSGESNTQKNFGVETIMNAYCKKNMLHVVYVVMLGVTHIIKEKKYGFWTGIRARIKMFFEIVRAELETLLK